MAKRLQDVLMHLGNKTNKLASAGGDHLQRDRQARKRGGQDLSAL